MRREVVIDERFRGPPDSGNGGYVCGIVAGLIDGPAEVTLRRPPPLGRPLGIQRLGDGAIALRDGESTVAVGISTDVDIDVPDPVTFADAEKASAAYVGFRHHFFPMCFTCGPDRADGDGLRIFPGPVDGREVVAAPWAPDASLSDEFGAVRPEFVWAALDCPGLWALLTGPLGRPAVLGRLAVKIMGTIERGQRCVVIGWPIGADGRKLYAGTALFSDTGELRALAKATWVELAQRPSDTSQADPS